MPAKVQTLAPGLTLTSSQYLNAEGGKVEEKYLTYTPGAGSMPVTAYGKTLYGMSTIKYVADYLTEQGSEVVSGINGDFYMTDTGIPIGMVVTDGILRTSDAGAAALGIRADGSAFLGYPALKVTAVTDSGYSVLLNYVNKTRKNYGTYLITPDYSATTRVTGESLIVVLGQVSGPLTVGGFVNAKVTEILTTEEARGIGPEELLITATVENGNADKISGFQIGDNVQIRVEPAEERWKEAVSAVGVGDLLLDNGQPLEGLAAVRHPRTAVGITADGNLIAYVADGRNAGWSVGMSLVELAERMAALGCVSAANLDGGGSSAMIASLPGRSDLATQNKPSEGKLRIGANGLFFLNVSPRLDAADRFYFYPETVTLLAGTSYTAVPYGADANYHPVELPADARWTADGPGTVDQQGTYTAPVGYTGADAVWVSSGEAYGKLEVQVVASPDKIVISRNGSTVTALRLTPGEQIKLDAACEYSGAPIAAAASLYLWNATEGIGTIGQDGTFTATAENGVKGTITVAYGETTAAIPVIVGQGSVLLENYEGEGTGMVPLTDGISAALETELGTVRYGEASAKIVTSFPEGAEQLSLGTNWRIPAGALRLTLWVCGDNSQNELGLSILLEDGNVWNVKLCDLNYKGYRQQTVSLPENAAAVTALQITRKPEGRATGTVYLDQLVAAYSQQNDTVPPAISLALDTGSTPGSALLSAVLTDNDSKIDPTAVTVRMDGEKMGFSFSPENGTLISTLLSPEDGKLHRVTVEVSDASGNVSRRTCLYDLRGEQWESPFADAPGSSAETEANYLNDRGVLNGAKDKDGLLKYFPARTMTRAEFAVLMTGYLGVNASDYAAVELPFTDAEAIDWWARDAVAAMYALGVINGKLRNDGTVIYDGKATVTRADMATVLGRTLPGGYIGAALSFADEEKIPTYAKEHVAVLASFGAVEKAEYFRPTEAATRGEVVKMIYGMY